ncbi:MAG: hypothetical protein FWD83_10995, partial [Promicromonosporaceae bacterium]|nr:hypothetical protein [Promicromonosporaceae bacterium]
MRCRARAARRGSAALAAALLLPALGIYLAAPAVAASANAVLLAANPAGPWEQHLAVSPLATAPTRWVPGDSATGTLYLITQACTGATGTVAVTYTGAQSDIPLAQYLTFSATI